MRELIYIVIENFYKLALNDVLIGYHFHRFQKPEVLSHHLERITTFWEMQFTGTISKPLEGEGFRLLFTHLQMNLKPGELGRWIVLFHKTLDELNLHFQNEGSSEESKQIEALVLEWKKKIAFFEERFKSHPQMFRSQN